MSGGYVILLAHIQKQKSSTQWTREFRAPFRLQETPTWLHSILASMCIQWENNVSQVDLSSCFRLIHLLRSPYLTATNCLIMWTLLTLGHFIKKRYLLQHCVNCYVVFFRALWLSDAQPSRHLQQSSPVTPVMGLQSCLEWPRLI